MSMSISTVESGGSGLKAKHSREGERRGTQKATAFKRHVVM